MGLTSRPSPLLSQPSFHQCPLVKTTLYVNPTKLLYWTLTSLVREGLKGPVSTLRQGDEGWGWGESDCRSPEEEIGLLYSTQMCVGEGGWKVFRKDILGSSFIGNTELHIWYTPVPTRDKKWTRLPSWFFLESLIESSTQVSFILG